MFEIRKEEEKLNKKKIAMVFIFTGIFFISMAVMGLNVYNDTKLFKEEDTISSLESLESTVNINDALTDDSNDSIATVTTNSEEETNINSTKYYIILAIGLISICALLITIFPIKTKKASA